MKGITTTPSTLLEAVRYFSNPENCIKHIVAMRWPNGVECPTCGRKDIGYLKNQQRFQCGSHHSKRQFSVKVGTIFEDSPLGLDKWLPAVWLLNNAKNGISSYELARAIGVTQKTAWFMLHRIRHALGLDENEVLSGEVEADETFHGGKAKFMHHGKFTAKGRGPVGKDTVFGMVERNGRVIAKTVPDRKKQTLHKQIENPHRTRVNALYR